MCRTLKFRPHPAAAASFPLPGKSLGLCSGTSSHYVVHNSFDGNAIFACSAVAGVSPAVCCGQLRGRGWAGQCARFSGF